MSQIDLLNDSIETSSQNQIEISQETQETSQIEENKLNLHFKIYQTLKNNWNEYQKGEAILPLTLNEIKYFEKKLFECEKLNPEQFENQNEINTNENIIGKTLWYLSQIPSLKIHSKNRKQKDQITNITLSEIFPTVKTLQINNCILNNFLDFHSRFILQLESLTLDDCALNSFKEIFYVESQEGLKLKSLICINNQISHFEESLSILKNLEYLDLRGNKISNITGIENLDVTYLYYVNWSFNQLYSTEELNFYLGNIQELYLTGNKLETTEGIRKLFSLEILDISRNKIKSISEIEALQSLPSLEYLNVELNPCTNSELFRVKIFYHLDRLVLLDENPMSKEEEELVKFLVKEKPRKGGSFSSLHLSPPKKSTRHQIESYSEVKDLETVCTQIEEKHREERQAMRRKRKTLESIVDLLEKWQRHKRSAEIHDSMCNRFDVRTETQANYFQELSIRNQQIDLSSFMEDKEERILHEKMRQYLDKRQKVEEEFSAKKDHGEDSSLDIGTEYFENLEKLRGDMEREILKRKTHIGSFKSNLTTSDPKREADRFESEISLYKKEGGEQWLRILNEKKKALAEQMQKLRKKQEKNLELLRRSIELGLFRSRILVEVVDPSQRGTVYRVLKFSKKTPQLFLELDTATMKMERKLDATALTHIAVAQHLQRLVVTLTFEEATKIGHKLVVIYALYDSDDADYLVSFLGLLSCTKTVENCIQCENIPQNLEQFGINGFERFFDIPDKTAQDSQSGNKTTGHRSGQIGDGNRPETTTKWANDTQLDSTDPNLQKNQMQKTRSTMESLTENDIAIENMGEKLRIVKKYDRNFERGDRETIFLFGSRFIDSYMDEELVSKRANPQRRVQNIDGVSSSKLSHDSAHKILKYNDVVEHLSTGTEPSGFEIRKDELEYISSTFFLSPVGKETVIKTLVATYVRSNEKRPSYLIITSENIYLLRFDKRRSNKKFQVVFAEPISKCVGFRIGFQSQYFLIVFDSKHPMSFLLMTLSRSITESFFRDLDKLLLSHSKQTIPVNRDSKTLLDLFHEKLSRKKRKSNLFSISKDNTNVLYLYSIKLHKRKKTKRSLVLIGLFLFVCKEDPRKWAQNIIDYSNHFKVSKFFQFNQETHIILFAKAVEKIRILWKKNKKTTLRFVSPSERLVFVDFIRHQFIRKFQTPISVLLQ